jgi:hypothetical protein
VDQSLSKVDFSPLAGRAVMVQEKYIDGVDKNYVVASVRHRVLATGARLVEKEDDADVVVEIRSGGIGTDRVENFIGMPQVATPGPLPLQIPEIRLIDSKVQTATAKIGIVAYEAKTKHAVGSGGLSLARSEDTNWSVLGIGPFANGDVRTEVASSTGHKGSSFDVASYVPPLGRSERGPVAPVRFAAPPEEAGGRDPFPPPPPVSGSFGPGPELPTMPPAAAADGPR